MKSKLFNKITACILTIAMLLPVIPLAAFADGENEYTASNGYLTFTYNADTGGFALETDEGNPKKILDNGIPLLYSEDKSRSNGTSFLTVRIDDKDYIFGQDYGFFGMSSHLGEITSGEDGRLITIPWTINGVTVTLKVALSQDENSDITGNAGISAEVKNESGESKNVSLRLLLDTALGNETDAPYFVVDEEISPTLTEREFTADNIPGQIRGVDSLSRPAKMSYILTKGWNGGTVANRIVLGHWANLANTRYAYTPNTFCDFTNYSNDYKTPDGAAALYWENKNLSNGASFTGEALYGVGNFANDKDDAVGLNLTVGRVELDDGKTAYKNNGEFDVTAEIDNTAGEYNLAGGILNITVNDDEFEVLQGGTITFGKDEIIGKEVITKKYRLRAKPQQKLTAGSIYISFTANAADDAGNLLEDTIETAAQKSVILQSVAGDKAVVQMNKINPDIVYTQGEKAVTITGDMSPFKALAANQGWELKLVNANERVNHSVTVKKKNVAFLDDTYENMSFTVSDELYVGYYNIVFEFTDPILKEEFGKSIVCKHKLQVSDDKKYAMKLYGTIALVRTTDSSNNTDYDFFTFKNEGEYLKFYKGELQKTGEIKQTKIKYNFGKDMSSIKEHEILLTVRANLREMTRGEGENKQKYWQADYAEGDIIINNMLSYEGNKPLEISNSGDIYTVKGDGLLKVVNSINVWRSKWSFNVTRGIIHTLDTRRMDEECNIKGASPVMLSFDGAATLIQSIGGFLIDLKYGEMSSNWYKGGDGTVTYGIGFGGSMSIPISAKKKKTQQPADLTSDQEDISDAMNSLFDESMTSDQEDMSADLNNLFDETPKTTSDGSKLKKDTKLSEGQLSVEVNSVLFGEDGDVEDGKVKVSDTGFLGIDTTTSLALPKDLLGSLVSNAPGVYASVTINTIDNIYELNAGISIKVIECEATLAFREVRVKNKDKILPDKIEFYIRDGLKIPLTPPVLFMTGLGGGVNELAKTIGGEFDELPPITLLLFTRLEAINTLVGDFNAKLSLEGMSLKGDMKLKLSDKLLNLEAGISARWIEPWQLNLYGNISIIDGLIKGGVTINIAHKYFYGYIYATICVPDSIPFVGGKELAGVEAALSDEFIGANIKILGIGFGVIYYWGDKVSFGKNIDLSAPAQQAQSSLQMLSSDDVTGYYGTNVHALNAVALPVTLEGGNAKTASVNVDNAKGQDNLLLEIPFTGTGIPKAGEITLINSNGDRIPTTPDDGKGGGNMLVQSRNGKRYIYITVTENNKILNGKWTVEYTTENVKIDSFSVNGVDDISQITECGISQSAHDNFKVSADWKISGSDKVKGDIDVYLTKDPELLGKLKTSDNSGNSLGVNILHIDNTQLKDGSMEITLPDTLESGEYYAVTSVSSQEGISLAISDKNKPFKFKNPKLPHPVESVHINYGGNGNLFVSVTDNKDNMDYTHYIAEICASDGTTLTNNLGQFEQGKNFVFGKEAGLKPGSKYTVRVKTLREEYAELSKEEGYKKIYYYGDDSDIVTSNEFEMTDTKLPALISLNTNINKDAEFINQNSVTVEYTFDDDVFVELDVNGQKAYSAKGFKKDWKFVLDGLEDGDYIIDFTAYKANKDHIKATDMDNSDDAVLAFTIDTSAPILSLARRYADSLETGGQKAEAALGTNTVFADKDGKYTIEGITEKSVKLTADDSTDGIEIAPNGAFTIIRTLANGENQKTHTIKAEDKAGNTSYLTVSVVREGSFAYKSLELKKDGEKIPSDGAGKKITVKNGQSFKISADALSRNGVQTTLENDDILWNILYEKNIISLNGGTVTALNTGETALMATYSGAESKAETKDGTQVSQNLGLSDYTVIEILNNSKSDLADKISEAQKVLASEPDASDARKGALSSAIDTAIEVLNNSASTDVDYTKQVSNLTAAIETFKRGDVKKPNKGSSSSVSGGMYTITVVPAQNGTVNVSQTKVRSGGSVTVTAQPNEGYSVADMLINGISVGREQSYTIQNITQNTTVEVKFGEKSDLPFDDVLKDDWFYETVKEAYGKGYVNGTSDTKFEPETAVNRAMFVTILYRADQSGDTGTHNFTDVEKGSYYENAVAWAAKNGIVKGVTQTEFAPYDLITREQAAAMLFRYAAFKGEDITLRDDLSKFSDCGLISNYAKDAISWASANGIIKGKTDTTVNPLDNATRAEAAAILVRFFNK